MEYLRFITALEQALDELTLCDYPNLLGQIERLKALVWSKMIDGTAQAKGRTENNENLLTITQVAQRLNVKASFAYELTRCGKLRSVRVGKKYLRVTEQALAEYQATLAKNYGLTQSYANGIIQHDDRQGVATTPKSTRAHTG